VSTRPPLRSRKKRRPFVVVGTDFVDFGLAIAVDIEFTYSFSEISMSTTGWIATGLPRAQTSNHNRLNEILIRGDLPCANGLAVA
jgi:hypothetical protein